MRVNVYLSGKSATGAPWNAVARADLPLHNQAVEQHVRALSGGAPVFMATVEIPDDALTPAPIVQIEADEPTLVAS
jgi:hypothetical protein